MCVYLFFCFAEEFKCDPITCDLLKNEKGFVKANKKQQKEYETLIKKQLKERGNIQAKQCKDMEKLAKGKKSLDAMNDSDVLDLVKEQTKQWTELMTKHRKEEWEMLKAHIALQEEIFKKLFGTVQAQQMKDMDIFFDK